MLEVSILAKEYSPFNFIAFAMSHSLDTVIHKGIYFKYNIIRTPKLMNFTIKLSNCICEKFSVIFQIFYFGILRLD